MNRAWPALVFLAGATTALAQPGAIAPADNRVLDGRIALVNSTGVP